ncbi:hypothetical protein LEL_06937 [Akanthomyces lecanii RCEF 1005]|uniref:Uncharacterized protein n=1 Tax=Akanthomyces lecanii RCEF 1005 TaxID=1081108 RepID=A0A162N3H2_CORDF|nr:hypothetical protein LEL_06937 [Akanthomyces lecanii RCEF 1005]
MKICKIAGLFWAISSATSALASGANCISSIAIVELQPYKIICSGTTTESTSTRTYNGCETTPPDITTSVSGTCTAATPCPPVTIPPPADCTHPYYYLPTITPNSFELEYTIPDRIKPLKLKYTFLDNTKAFKLYNIPNNIKLFNLKYHPPNSIKPVKLEYTFLDNIKLFKLEYTFPNNAKSFKLYTTHDNIELYKLECYVEMCKTNVLSWDKACSISRSFHQWGRIQ